MLFPGYSQQMFKAFVKDTVDRHKEIKILTFVKAVEQCRNHNDKKID